MKKYVYTVARIRTAEDEEKVISIVKSCVDVKEIEASFKTSSICFLVNGDTVSQEEMERKLSYELLRQGFELILPENVSTFVPDTPKKSKEPKHVSVLTAVILTVIAGLFCAMLTFGVCSRFMSPKSDGETPEYINELSILDKFFREYSLEGISDEEDFGENLLKAYVAFSGDKYARYYTEEELKALEQDKTGEFTGIGISATQGQLTIDSQTSTVIDILYVYESSSALEQGLKAGDKITHIGVGEDKKSVDELGYSNALSQIVGEEGTQVGLTVYGINDDGEYEYREVLVTRKKIEGVSVFGKVCEEDTDVGIIRITGFDYNTPTQFCNSVEALKSSGCTSFVIDLRDNPGGYAESVIAILSYFLEEGDLIMTTEDKDGKVCETQTVKERKNQYFSVTKEDIGKYKDMRFCVLVNENTASAAELMTATVRDYGLGKIIGETTFGKGCLQTTYLLEYYGLPGALKLTTHLYYSKSHTTYHEVGITPDVKVSLSDEAKNYVMGYIPYEFDNQLQSAIQILKNITI